MAVTISSGGAVTAAAPIGDALEEKVKDALRKHLLTRKEALLAAPAATPVVKKVEKKKEVVVKTGQRLFSEIVKPLRLSADLPDFAVSVLDPATLDSRVSAFVPKLDPSYVIQVKEAHALMMAWEMSEKCLITGPTGSGKSSLVQYCCALTNRPMIRVNMTGDMESHVLFGTLTVENGSTVWKDGPVTEGVLYGCVVCIDEWDVTPPEIFFSMQWLLEREGKLFLKEKPGDSSEKMMQPHGDFRLVCLGNTVGQGDDTGRYSGTNVQNTASVDRFDTTVVLSYLDKTHELGVLKSQCKELDADVAGKMVTMAALVRQACDTSQINLTMSPRTLINWGLKQTVYDTRTALALAFLNKLRESDRKIVEEMYYKVFGR